MAAFLILVGFVVLILYKQIEIAFNANPGLNGLIIGVLTIGALFAFRQIFRLFREIRWVNSLSNSQVRPPKRGPRLLGPMATLINAGAGARGLSTATSRAILDSVGTRLDEGRELNRYLIGLLVFLGLLGTFWGLLGDGPFDQRRHQLDADRRGRHRHVRRPEERPRRADRRHEHFVHLLAVRPRRLADPRLSRSAGGPGAEPVLHRA